MVKNILQLLEDTNRNFPNKIAFGESQREITYNEFTSDCKKIGTFLSKLNNNKKPIVIFIDKTINCLEAMFGVLYSGNFYTIIDTKSPRDRMQSIIDTLEPIAVVTDEKNKAKLEKL